MKVQPHQSAGNNDQRGCRAGGSRSPGQLQATTFRVLVVRPTTCHSAAQGQATQHASPENHQQSVAATSRHLAMASSAKHGAPGPCVRRNGLLAWPMHLVRVHLTRRHHAPRISPVSRQRRHTEHPSIRPTRDQRKDRTGRRRKPCGRLSLRSVQSKQEHDRS